MRTLCALVPLFAAAVVSSTVLADAPEQSLGYVLQADKLASSKAEAVRILAESDRDVIVLDAFFDGSVRWTNDELNEIRQGKERRKILCYLSIGEAEDYRPYWRSEWDADKDGTPDSKAPAFLNTENPHWEGNYKVRYWDRQWQRVILGEVKQIVAQGFDGVYLDIVDAYEFYEFDAETREWKDHRPNRETGNTYREDMVHWITTLRETLNEGGQSRWVIPQNGEALLQVPGFQEVIDGIAAEDVFTDGEQIRADADVRYRVSFLEKVQQAKQPVYVVEYPAHEQARNAARKRAREHGFSLLLTQRALTTLGESVP